MRCFIRSVLFKEDIAVVVSKASVLRYIFINCVMLLLQEKMLKDVK